MKVTHLGHSCLLVEVADARVLLDPGGWSEGFEGLTGLDAVVVTHQHPDHVDVTRLPDVMRANPSALLVCDPGTAPSLEGLGLQPRVQDGSQVRVGEAVLTPVGELHALIHDDLPRVTNVGVVVSAPGEPRLFHPGDALDGEPGEVDVLAFPLQAPWQRSRDMTAFLRRVAAPVAFPIHDGLLQARGRALYLGQAGQLGCADTELRDLAGAGPTTFAG